MAHEHSFASPAPAGLAALAVACFGFGAAFLGKVAVEGLPLLFAWLMGGRLIQYTTAVIKLRDHNIFANWRGCTSLFTSRSRAAPSRLLPPFLETIHSVRLVKR